MSRIFYDHLIILEKVEIELSSREFNSKEKEEIHNLIEETIHFRVMTRILEHLPRLYHEKFLDIFHKSPHSEDNLTFLKKNVENIEEIIKEEVSLLENALLKDIKFLSK